MNFERFNHYWNQWNERERVLVVVAALFLSLYVLYAFCYAPLNTAIQRYQEQLSSQQAILQWMQNARAQYQHTATPQSLNSGQLLTLLGQQLTTSVFHQYPSQLEQTSTGDIQLSFEEVPYNAFLLWFKKFNVQYALTIKQFSAQRAKASGTVKLLIVMSVVP